MSELALFEHAKESVAAAVRIDEVMDLHTEAQRAKAYAKIARDRRMVADAQEIIARAERKLGILIRKVKESGLLSTGGRPANSNLNEPETSDDAAPVFDSTPFTLQDLGISKKLSSRAQQLAALDEGVFEEEVATKRDKILAADAAVVSPPRVIKVKPPKVEKAQPLEPRRFHQFAFSMVAMSMASDRVSSEALLFLAEECGVVVRDGDTVDFTPEALEAFGNLAAVALKAIDGKHDGEDFAASAQADAYLDIIAHLAPSRGKLTMTLAEPALRAAYAIEVPLAQVVEDLGHPHGTIAGWANRLGLTKKARMHANQKRFGGAS